MTLKEKTQLWWDRSGMRFLGGESGQHIPSHRDFAVYGFQSGYLQGFEDACSKALELIKTAIPDGNGVATEPQEDE
jgi:hypothetical protein